MFRPQQYRKRHRPAESLYHCVRLSHCGQCRSRVVVESAILQPAVSISAGNDTDRHARSLWVDSTTADEDAGVSAETQLRARRLCTARKGGPLRFSGGESVIDLGNTRLEVRTYLKDFAEGRTRQRRRLCLRVAFIQLLFVKHNLEISSRSIFETCDKS
jgi:hypothetical protein